MPLRDYSEDDDFYSQNFEKKDSVSIWIWTEQITYTPNTDVLQDLCGVGYYSLDSQETNTAEHAPQSLKKLFRDISYSKSFIDEVLKAAKSRKIEKAYSAVVQFDFIYDTQVPKRTIAKQPIFLGVFRYQTK